MEGGEALKELTDAVKDYDGERAGHLSVGAGLRSGVKVVGGAPVTEERARDVGAGACGLGGGGVVEAALRPMEEAHADA